MDCQPYITISTEANKVQGENPTRKLNMKQEQFDTLIRKLEDFSQRNPGSYRLRVALFAALGYIYLFIVLAGLLALVSMVAIFAIFSHHLNGFIIKLAILLLIPAWVILRSLWVTFPPPQGLSLSRRQVPHLFALLDELTTKLQTSRFHKILLNREFNAAVVQVPRLGIFGWQKNYLLLGLPLMQSLSLEQLKAVLAHELGHLSGNHSRFAGWIYRVRKTWMQIYQRLHQSEHAGESILFNRFLDWYWPFFNAYSFVLARMNEYEADRCAAQLTGRDNAAEALINVEIKARFLESYFWSDISNQVEYQADPPESTYTSMLTFLHRPILDEDGEKLLKESLAEKTNNQDTHPSLRDRLKSLGYLTNQTEQLPQSVTIETSAAEYLLGNLLPEFATKFDRDWQIEASTPWRQRYGYLQEIQSKLQPLEQKAQIQIITDEEKWERAYYTLELRGSETALPLLQEVLITQPNHASANYTLGQILLKKSDRAGVTCIEKAIEQKVDWVINGCELVYNFLCQQGETEEAQKYRERAEQHYQLTLKAQQERSILSVSDSFKPHTLTESEVNKLKQQLAAYSQIKEAYLVEKVLTYFPEDRLCLLGIIRKHSFLESQYAPHKLVEALAANLQFTTQVYIIILNHGQNGKFKQKIYQIEDSLIFRR